MRAIYKKNKGAIIIISLIVMGVLIISGIYFLNFVLVESAISKNQTWGYQAYYLAEAGINKAIWKLRYDKTTADGDDAWAICFATSTVQCGNCENWSDSFSATTTNLISNSFLTVSIQNSTCAKGKIIATSTILFANGKKAQRVVETTVYKALASPTQGAAVFSGGASENINIDFSKIKVYGNLFSNNNLNISWWSDIKVYPTSSGEGKVLAVNNYNKSSNSSVSSTAVCAKNICYTTTTCECHISEKFQECQTNNCPPVSIATPLVDFDSASSTSFKSRARELENQGKCRIFCKRTGQATTTCSNKCIFSGTEFEDLLWQVREGGTLTLGTFEEPVIVYVEGQIDLKGGRYLVINGALLADDTINIGERYTWTKKGEKDEGLSQITINRPTATTSSGLLTKDKINFGLYSSFTKTKIFGVVYANDEIRITSFPQEFYLQGGIIARKLSFTSILQWFNFVLDDEIILYGLGYKINGINLKPAYSPIITVDHWEESY